MRYARKCDITNEGMNEGWFTSDDTYIKYEEDLIKWCEKKGYDFIIITEEHLKKFSV